MSADDDGDAPMEGAPARQVGRRTYRWKVTQQPARTQVAHCRRCKLAFRVGELRLGSAPAVNASQARKPGGRSTT